jgi:hypothetical protein
VICYESKKLKDREKKNGTHDLELAIVVHSLKMWWHYSLGSKYQSRTYHQSLKYLFEKTNMNLRQAQWMELLSEFHFTIKNIKHKEN